MGKNILLIGSEKDTSSMDMQKRLAARNAHVILFDTAKYPYEIKITFDANSPACGYIQENSSNLKIPISEINAVYRRWSNGVRVKPEEDRLLQEIVYWNIESAIGSFLKCLDCRQVNPYESVEMHKYKGYQLKLMKQNNIRIPESIITNDPDELIDFYEKNNKKVIYKPVRGWANTAILTDDKLTAENLASLSNSPVTAQELIEGTDIRAYIVDKDIYALEINAKTIDFRAENNAKRIPIKLEESVIEDCFKINDILGLVFSGIDMKRTPSGEYVFFEANPTPVFLYDEECCNYPISESIVNLLLKE